MKTSFSIETLNFLFELLLEHKYKVSQVSVTGYFWFLSTIWNQKWSVKFF